LRFSDVVVVSGKQPGSNQGWQAVMARAANILLVEDNSDDATLVCTAVQRTLAGIRVIVVGDGQGAINYLGGDGPYRDRATYPFPDLVLLDLKMPLVNGFEVLTWIPSQPALKGLPVVILTGSVLASDNAQAY
jgi:CheY-like chemotaxis protein